MKFPAPSTSRLPKISSGSGIRPKSGGCRSSYTCMYPPLPAPPAPPWLLAPPAPSPPVPPPPPYGVPRLFCLWLGKKAPPEPRLDPEVEAMACACDITFGSWVALSAITDWRMSRNLWFSVKESGVGGRAVVVPMAISGLGGNEERRESVWPLMDRSSGKRYCRMVNRRGTLEDRWTHDMGIFL